MLSGLGAALAVLALACAEPDPMSPDAPRLAGGWKQTCDSGVTPVTGTYTTQFRRDNRAVPDEASIRMDIYLSTDRTRTGIGMDRRPCLLFKTHHRSKLVHLILSDMTDRGGQISKEGEYTLEQVNDVLIKEKFILLFHRLMSRA